MAFLARWHYDILMAVNLSIFSHVLIFLAGSFLFLFNFWRRLKEDYSAELIFNSAMFFVLLIPGGFLLAFLLARLLLASFVFNPAGLWFWGSFAGFLSALWLSVVKFRLRQVEIFEAAVFGISFWLLLVYLVNGEAGLLAIMLLLYGVFYYIKNRYRSFSWYKSGKAGFSGLAVAAIFFIIRTAGAVFVPGMFSLVGKADFVPSAAIAFLLLFSLYNLSEG